MAVLAIAGAGAIAGGFIGGGAVLGAAGAAAFSLTGAAIGWSVGSVVGNLLFPPSGPNISQTGPRLSDLKVMSAAYGQPIPVSYGTVRLAGNVIWAKNIREVKNTDTTSSGGGKGGGGGGSVTTTTYKYYGSFATAFGAGPCVNVLRIWADGKLIYNRTGNSRFKKSGWKIRVYRGVETQNADAAIKANKGAANTPAYRGLVYVVFDDVPLADFGNRIPQISAEVAFEGGSPSSDVVGFDRTTVSGTIEGLVFDRQRARLYGGLIDGSHVRGNAVWSYPSGELLYAATQAEAGLTGDNSHVPLQVFPDGKLLCKREGAGRLAIVNPDSLLTEAVSAANYTSGVGAVLISPGPSGNVYYVAGFTGTNGTPRVLPRADMSEIFSAGAVLNPSEQKVWTGGAYPGYGEAFFGCLSGGVIRFSRVRVPYNADEASGNNITYDDHTVIGTLAPADVGMASFTSPYYAMPIWDVTDETFVLPVFDASTFRLVKYQPESGVVWFSEAVSRDKIIPADYWSDLYLSSGVVGFCNFNGDPSSPTYGYVKFDTLTGDIIVDKTWSAAPLTSNIQSNPALNYDSYYDADLDAFLYNRSSLGITGGGIIFVDRASGGDANLSDIVSDLMIRSGLSASQIDVTELIDTVKGYTVGRQTPARTCVDQLAVAYKFDPIEIDGKIKFIKRGGSSVATVPQQDLGKPEGEADGEWFSQTRIQEVELPVRVSIVYSDKAREYDSGTQSDKRVAEPVRTMFSYSELTYELPIVLSATEAKQIAARTLDEAWISRNTFKFSLGPEYLRLDPGDIITVNLDNGQSYTLRIVKATHGANLVSEFEAVAEDEVIYSQTIEGDAGEDVESPDIPENGVSKLFVINTPLLRDVDDPGGLAVPYYLASGPYLDDTDWPGASILRSSDGVGYEDRTQILTEVPWGVCLNTLGVPWSPHSPDDTNTLTVRMIYGGSVLATVTELEWLNGANAALVGNEIIKFRDVTDNGGGSYTLSRLMRGRRGTDVYADSHGASERFVLLSPQYLSKDAIDLAAIDSTFFFKAVTFGTLAENTASESTAITAAALKPWAPVNAKRADSGSPTDITITWNRRTRIGGEWLNNTGYVGLGEDTESYSVDILSGSGGSVVRTLTSSTQSVTYTAAQIATDLGSSPGIADTTTIYCRIYQVSAQVGRGFSYEWALQAV